MIKKLNQKGFTLIELLATIAILILIGAITIVASTEFYEISKRKSEEAFKNQLRGYLDDYLALNGGKLGYEIANYGNNGIVQKCYFDVNETKCNDTTLTKAKTNPQFNDVIDEIVNEKVINPSTEVECNSENLTINVYRDSDYVYCFTINPNGDSCINNTIYSCKGIYKYNNSDITLD